jgi:hypothetical protein
MITITLISGIFAGRTRVMPAGKNPNDIYPSFIKMNWDWKTDYSQASETEAFIWFRVELVAKIIYYLVRGRPVFFLGREYRARDSNYLQVGQQLEDDIVASGQMITIDVENEQKLIIGTKGYEQ